MDAINLASLLGPSPVFLTVEQLNALNELAQATEGAVAVMVLNEGGTTVTARVLVGTRPIPSEADIVPESETVIGARGGFYPVGITAESTEEEIQYAVTAALESATEEGRDLIEAETSARENDLPLVLQ